MTAHELHVMNLSVAWTLGIYDTSVTYSLLQVRALFFVATITHSIADAVARLEAAVSEVVQCARKGSLALHLPWRCYVELQ
jgi:hypothetical protein